MNGFHNTNGFPAVKMALNKIPLMDLQSVTSVMSMFSTQAKYPYLTDGIAGFDKLGKAFTGTSSSNHTLDLSSMEALTKTSVMNIINHLSAPDDATCTDATLKLSAASYALLDASDIAIATAKRWSVISA